MMKNRFKRKKGMILFVVAIIIAMLALGSLALLSYFSAEYEATVLRGDELQASQLVQSGIERIARVIETAEMKAPLSETEFSDAFASTDSTQKKETFGSHRLYDNPALFRAIEVVPDMLGRPSRGAGRFTIFSPKIENNRLRGIRFGLVNESTRLHLGSVLQWEQQTPGQGVRALMKLPGMTPAAADSILDWIDPDKSARASGAELDYYKRAGMPYLPRNDVPSTLEELLLVRDVTRPLLFGDDPSFSYGAKMSALGLLQSSLEDQNELLFGTETAQESESESEADTNSEPAETSFFSDMNLDSANPAAAPTGILPWCYLITTVSAEKLVDPKGQARISLNESNLEFLEEQLKTFLNEDAVRFIITWRKTKGKIADPIELLDETIKEEGSEKELKSPFSLSQTESEELFLTLLDYACCSDSVIIRGRINVNEAPSVVLGSIPELNSVQVGQILGRRGTFGSTGAGPTNRFRHSVWLLSEKIVDKPTMLKLSSRLTTGGDVYRAQVVGFFDRQGTSSRVEVVIDATVRPPRQILSKDLTMFGSDLMK